VVMSEAPPGRPIPCWTGLGGGRYSMGGQVAIRDGLHLDMRGMDRMLFLDTTTPCVRVQAGMRWRRLQAYLDPHELSVKTMQSYANFTVGGAVSVNAHGRYVGNGPVGNSVRALQLVLADGSVVEASRTENPELFSAAIGGYGAVGVITEVELTLRSTVASSGSSSRSPWLTIPSTFEAWREPATACSTTRTCCRRRSTVRFPCPGMKPGSP
jgi:FAD/FMN-containing dehydrogenase